VLYRSSDELQDYVTALIGNDAEKLRMTPKLRNYNSFGFVEVRDGAVPQFKPKNVVP
jgi:hypothetical protein